MGRGVSHGIEFRLLGTVEVVAGDRAVEIGSPKQRTLLAALLLRLNAVVPAQVLVDDLWGESPPASAQATLQSLVSRLRRVLEAPVTGDEGDPPRLRGREGGYILETSAERVDANRFDRLAAEGRRSLADGDGVGAVARLEAALALWRGSALGDLSDLPFARLEAHRLEEARVAAVEDLAEALLTAGRAQDAVARLESHVVEHPLRERPWGQLILALYRVGRQADALRAYQKVRRILGEQLGVEPTPELRRLEEQILRQSTELAAPVTRAANAAAPVPAAANTVAFLFTDIEASTRRWESDQEAMASDLARHDALLLEVMEAYGGEAFSHTGDGFCVAFPTVPAAMAAAVAVQRKLIETAWSSPAPLRVRMAVHAGAAERRAGNWFGPTLNRTARLMSTAAGGQVVCSQIAVQLGADDVPSEVGLVDLGEHRLADLNRPERVYQVTHPDLPSEFPPLRSLDTRRHNLPVALTTFVGREQELSEVLSLLGASRLVTLVGTGGAGKTRLALQAAAGALARFPDGAWFVELAPVRDPNLVVNEAVTALGFLPGGSDQPGDSPEERLCDQLQNRRLLLVLDNCEHVIEAAARLVHTLLARCAGVTVLTTSREVLGVPAEAVWTMPPLTMPPDHAVTAEELAGSDAVMLFVERARAAQAGFGLTDANAAAVARICRRLDGIPLGLELAAAKTRVLGTNQLAERLDDRFRLLTGGSRTAVPRHQTLQAAMDWGYTLLPESEQVVLRRLAVFRGSFSLAAVDAVAAAEPEPGGDVEVLESLSRLVDKSMVAVTSEEPDVRYHLLETVREYAAQKLGEAGETDEIRTRHRDHFLGLADRWAATTGYWDWWKWLRQISIDDANFLAALEWSAARDDDDALLRLAAAHFTYWYWGEGQGWREWLPLALGRCDRPSPARVEGLLALAYLRLRSGDDYEACRPLFAEARQLAAGLATNSWPGSASTSRTSCCRTASCARPGPWSTTRSGGQTTATSWAGAIGRWAGSPCVRIGSTRRPSSSGRACSGASRSTTTPCRPTLRPASRWWPPSRVITRPLGRWRPRASRPRNGPSERLVC